MAGAAQHNLTGLALAYRRPQFLPLQAGDIGHTNAPRPDTESFIGPQQVSNPIPPLRVACIHLRLLVVRFGEFMAAMGRSWWRSRRRTY